MLSLRSSLLRLTSLNKLAATILFSISSLVGEGDFQDSKRFATAGVKTGDAFWKGLKSGFLKNKEGRRRFAEV